MSSKAYVTVSALTPLVKVLQISSQKKSFGSASVNSFQAAAAQEIALQWECETTFREKSKNVCLNAVAFHKFHKTHVSKRRQMCVLDEFLVNNNVLQGKRAHSNGGRTMQQGSHSDYTGQIILVSPCHIYPI